MIREDFRRLRNFSYQEVLDHYISKGFTVSMAKIEIGKIKLSAMLKLQKFRTRINRPVYFNCITEGKHAPGSAHYRFIAFDIRIGGKGKINWNNMIEAAIDVGFKGIGYYPFWNTPGMHVDDRTTSFQIWKRISTGKYVGVV